MATSTTRQASDASSFDEYAAAAWPWLYRCSYLLTGNHHDAEDLAQDTMLQVQRSWTKVRQADEPAAYVRRTMTNLLVSRRRLKRRRLEVLTDAPAEPRTAPTAGPEDRMVVWPHIVSLAPRQRAVIVLRYYEQLSEREIADALGCSVGTVKSTAHRALRSLRGRVDPESLGGHETSTGSEREEH